MGISSTLKEETFAISRCLAQFAKFCSREMFVSYKSGKFILAKKNKSFRLGKVKKSKNLNIYNINQNHKAVGRWREK